MKLKRIKITDKYPLLVEFGSYAAKDFLFPREGEEESCFIHLLEEENFEVYEPDIRLSI
ncbi:hypothetical protein IX329_001009 [Fusobacterium necrophorum]|nr:hypothetical protein [Fusobacterium necrophorum]MBR8733435.1 hypothetical protein [Fusobacterium necrophorum]MBR8789612.1 hypothetical protein [Fusobacterium necrophorum]